MSDSAPTLHVSYEEYLEFERNSTTRHEFLDGTIVAMSGSTPQHALLTVNVGATLHSALRGKPCRAYSGDLRLRIVKTGLSTYPDLSVVCDELQHAEDDPHAIVNPTVIVEILSPTSEAYDRGEKFSHYRQIPSLRHYLLVSQRERRLELFTRAEGIGWTLAEAGPGEHLSLSTIDIALSVDEIYENIELDNSPSIIGKYAALFQWLQLQEGSTINVPFSTLDEVVGGLPASARAHVAWWRGSAAGSPQHVQKQAWEAAGFFIKEVKLDAETVTFQRQQ